MANSPSTTIGTSPKIELPTALSIMEEGRKANDNFPSNVRKVATKTGQCNYVCNLSLTKNSHSFLLYFASGVAKEDCCGAAGYLHSDIYGLRGCTCRPTTSSYNGGKSISLWSCFDGSYLYTGACLWCSFQSCSFNCLGYCPQISLAICETLYNSLI